MSDTDGIKKRKNKEQHPTPSFDYTKGRNVMERQTQYEDSIANQRGIQTKQVTGNDSCTDMNDYSDKSTNAHQKSGDIEELQSRHKQTENRYEHSTDTTSSISLNAKSEMDGRKKDYQHDDFYKEIEQENVHNSSDFLQRIGYEQKIDPSVIEAGTNPSSISRSQKESYDYTSARNIQDKQHIYEEKINQSRGIPSAAHSEKNTIPDYKEESLESFWMSEKSKNKEYPNKFVPNISDEIQQTIFEKSENSASERMYSSDNFSENGKRVMAPDDNTNYDYTKNIHIQDKQKQYDEEINQRRGIMSTSLSENDWGKENVKNPASEDSMSHISGKIFSADKSEHSVDKTEHFQNENQYNDDVAASILPAYDYTKSTPIREMQKYFEEQVRNRNFIPESKKLEGFSDARKNERFGISESEQTNEALQESIRKHVFQKNDYNSDVTETDISYNRKHEDGIRGGKEINVHFTENRKQGTESRPIIQTSHEGAQNKTLDQNEYNSDMSKADVSDKSEQAVKNDAKAEVHFAGSGIQKVSKKSHVSSSLRRGGQNSSTEKNAFDQKIAEKFSKIPKAGDNTPDYSDTESEKATGEKQKETIYVSRINDLRGVPPEQIQNKKIDLSELYEKSVRGGEKSSELALAVGASSEDIATLLQTRGLKPTSKIIFKVGDSVQRATNIAGTYMHDVTLGGTDAGQGLRMTKEYLDPVVFAVVDTAMMSMDKAMKKHLAVKLNKLSANYGVFKDEPIFIANAELGIDSAELKTLEEELKSKLKIAGHMELSGSGIVLQNQIRAYLRKNKGKLTRSEIGALKMYLSVAKCKTMDQNIHSRRKIFRRKILMKSFRYLQQTDAGAGALFTYNLIRNAKLTVTMGVNLLKTTKKTVELAGKLALRTSAQLAAKLAKTKLAQKIAQTKPGKAVSNTTKSVKKGIEKVANGRDMLIDKAKNSRLGKMKEAFDQRHQKFKAFRKDPFNLKKRRNNLRLKMKKSKLMKPVNAIFSPINLVKRAIGHVVATLMSVASYILSVLMVMAAMALLLLLIVVIVSAVISSLFGTFDFGANEEEIIEASFEMIRDNYEAHNNMIKGLYNGQYANVTVRYESIRDDGQYELEEHQLDEPLIETTNSAEMLSMAQVRFDFDLEEAGKSEVVEYIRQLYNGSHLLMITETPVWGKDEDGKDVIIETNASATLTTHYFNSLFDCQLSDTSGPIGSGGIIAGTEISEQVWNYFRSSGFSEESTAGIMGNMYQESGMNPESIQGGGRGPAAGICQWENYNTKTGRWKNLDNYASGFGKPWTDLKCQLDFLIKELNGGDSTTKSIMDKRYGGLANFKKSTDIEWSVEAFERSFERAGKPNMPRRIAKAKEYYEMYHGRDVITGNSKLAHPCPGARVTSEFGPRDAPTEGASTYHNGMDLAAPSGTPIIAANSGKVVKVVPASSGGARGNYIIIDHGNNLRTLYQHMKSRAIPNVGDTVQQGQKIGEVGNTGIGTGAHLHFEVHLNGKPVNPRNYVSF